MPISTINFFSEGLPFTLKNKTVIRKWIKETIAAEGFKTGEINFIFCDDQYLHQINVDYLQHDTYTDIITFDHANRKGYIEGDIFISVERTAENARSYNVSPTEELHRVMIHGILHLCGYLDKKPENKKEMTEKENFYLDKRHL